SGIMTTSAMPHARRQASTRRTMLARSAICRLEALAMTRRMSRADTGLAMIPTSGEVPWATPANPSMPIVAALFTEIPPELTLNRDSQDELRTDLDGSDFLDCPEARMGSVDAPSGIAGS